VRCACTRAFCVSRSTFCFSTMFNTAVFLDAILRHAAELRGHMVERTGRRYAERAQRGMRVGVEIGAHTLSVSTA
jgi:hypothetical protein